MPEPGVYGWSPGNGGVHHYRIAEPLRAARLHGIRAETGKELHQEICERHDTIVAHMLHHEHALPAWERLARIGHHRLVLDVDDAMWAPDWKPFRDAYTPGALSRLYHAVQLAHVVTTPSPVIAAWLEQFNRNVWILPNYIPQYLLHQRMRDRSRPTVGWQGSASHAPDITDAFLDGMRRFLREHRAWLWRIWGEARRNVRGIDDGAVAYVPWQDSIHAYYRSLSMDVGIGPLLPSMFTASKSSLRAIEYAALGIPAVLSSSPAYQGWVEHGVTGLLVDDDEQWYDALHYLARDVDLRTKMGRTARERAAGWTMEGNIDKWIGAWGSV
jgi:glycosyltransferase involved in cell wall biosynthesis